MVMQTLQIRLTKGLIEKAEELVKKGLYPNKSEVIRDAVRRLILEQEKAKKLLLFMLLLFVFTAPCSSALKNPLHYIGDYVPNPLSDLGLGIDLYEFAYNPACGVCGDSFESGLEDCECDTPEQCKDIYVASIAYDIGGASRALKDFCVSEDIVSEAYLDCGFIFDGLDIAMMANVECPPGFKCKNGACVTIFEQQIGPARETYFEDDGTLAMAEYITIFDTRLEEIQNMTFNEDHTISAESFNVIDLEIDANPDYLIPKLELSDVKNFTINPDGLITAESIGYESKLISNIVNLTFDLDGTFSAESFTFMNITFYNATDVIVNSSGIFFSFAQAAKSEDGFITGGINLTNVSLLDEGFITLDNAFLLASDKSVINNADDIIITEGNLSAQSADSAIVANLVSVNLIELEIIQADALSSIIFESAELVISDQNTFNDLVNSSFYLEHDSIIYAHLESASDDNLYTISNPVKDAGRYIDAISDDGDSIDLYMAYQDATNPYKDIGLDLEKILAGNINITGMVVPYHALQDDEYTFIRLRTDENITLYLDVISTPRIIFEPDNDEGTLTIIGEDRTDLPWQRTKEIAVILEPSATIDKQMLINAIETEGSFLLQQMIEEDVRINIWDHSMIGDYDSLNAYYEQDIPYSLENIVKSLIVLDLTPEPEPEILIELKEGISKDRLLEAEILGFLEETNSVQLKSLLYSNTPITVADAEEIYSHLDYLFDIDVPLDLSEVLEKIFVFFSEENEYELKVVVKDEQFYFGSTNEDLLDLLFESDDYDIRELLEFLQDDFDLEIIPPDKLYLLSGNSYLANVPVELEEYANKIIILDPPFNDDSELFVLVRENVNPSAVSSNIISALEIRAQSGIQDLIQQGININVDDLDGLFDFIGAAYEEIVPAAILGIVDRIIVSDPYGDSRIFILLDSSLEYSAEIKETITDAIMNDGSEQLAEMLKDTPLLIGDVSLLHQLIPDCYAAEVPVELRSIVEDIMVVHPAVLEEYEIHALVKEGVDLTNPVISKIITQLLRESTDKLNSIVLAGADINVVSSSDQAKSLLNIVGLEPVPDALSDLLDQILIVKTSSSLRDEIYNRESKLPIYHIENGSLSYENEFYRDSLTVTREATVAVDRDLGFVCSEITLPGTYCYYDLDTRKDFCLDSDSGYKLELCLRREHKRYPLESPLRAYVDFISKSINLRGELDYLRYWLDNDMIATLNLNRAFSGKMDPETLFLMDKNMIYIDKVNLNLYPYQGLLSITSFNDYY